MNKRLLQLLATRNIATFSGIVVLASGVGLIFDLLVAGFLIGLGAALIVAGNKLQDSKRQ
ncbi:MAG: hypothetical protein WD467_02475 [Candidatus Saccharimonadales bacterium]